MNHTIHAPGRQCLACQQQDAAARTPTHDGVEAHVFESTHRTRNGNLVPDFVVRILDADTGEWLPDGEHFRTLAGAQAYAEFCAR